MNLKKEAAEYSIALVGYEAAHKLPMDLLSRPDHLAIKAANIRHFELLVRSIDDVSEEVYCVDDQDRFVVAAKLAAKVAIGTHGLVKWLEIKEPRQSVRGKDLVGLEHAEFYYPDFNKALNVLKKKGLEPEVQSDGDHHRLNFIFSSDGHEVRVTDTPLSAIITEKIEREEAYIIKQAA